MAYSKVDLEKKLLEMYPEVLKNKVAMCMDFNKDKNAWIVEFKRDGKDLTTHLEKKDADDCMEGVKCVYLGVQIGQFVKNFEERK